MRISTPIENYPPVFGYFLPGRVLVYSSTGIRVCATCSVRREPSDVLDFTTYRPQPCLTLLRGSRLAMSQANVPRRWVKGNSSVETRNWYRGWLLTRLLAGRYRAAEGTCSALWFYYLFGSEVSNNLKFKFGRSMIEGSEILGAWIILASVILINVIFS